MYQSLHTRVKIYIYFDSQLILNKYFLVLYVTISVIDSPTHPLVRLWNCFFFLFPVFCFLRMCGCYGAKKGQSDFVGLSFR